MNALQIRLALLCSTLLFLTGCFGAYTGGVDTVIASADRSDPVRNAVAEALSVMDQDFAPLLTGPLSAAEKAEMIESATNVKGLAQHQSSLDMLRTIEAQSENARHISLEIPGATGIYYKTDLAQGTMSGTSRFIEWHFPVPFENRDAAAGELFARVSAMFAVDPKWNRSELLDPSISPMVASRSYSLYLSMSVSGYAEFAMVTVDYWHNEDDYKMADGIRLYVSKIASKAN